MTSIIKTRASHIWEREANNHYVEPRWVGRRLFEEEPFFGEVCDPCCGFGNMLAGAGSVGLQTFGFDLVDRGAPAFRGAQNFLDSTTRWKNFVMNPPFDFGREFALHALELAESKIAMVYPIRRLNAAGKWLERTPLYTVWYLTPRPSMPPGPVYADLIAKGREASGGKQDYCVLVWLKGFEGHPQHRWLRRDTPALRAAA